MQWGGVPGKKYEGGPRKNKGYSIWNPEGAEWKKNMWGGVGEKKKNMSGDVRKIFHSAPPLQDHKWNSPNANLIGV